MSTERTPEEEHVLLVVYVATAGGAEGQAANEAAIAVWDDAFTHAELEEIAAKLARSNLRRAADAS